MSNIIKNQKTGIFAIFVAAALVASIATFGDNMAFASNHGEQAILQAQPSSQDAQCVAGGDSEGQDQMRTPPRGMEPNLIDNGDSFDELGGIFASCNDIGLQFQDNDGNLALGQQ